MPALRRVRGIAEDLDRKDPEVQAARHGEGGVKVMNTYDALHSFLARQCAAEITLSFEEIGRLIGHPLPESAKLYDAFWANEEATQTRHYHCRAWRSAGYKAKADRSAGLVRFYKEPA
jgi:hypothetical protein